jgi:hypothetical protein
MARLVLQVLQAHKGYRVFKAQLDQLVLKAHKVSKVLQVKMVLQAEMALKVFRE